MPDTPEPQSNASITLEPIHFIPSVEEVPTKASRTVPYNENRAIASTSDILCGFQGAFTQFKTSYENIYLENGPQLDIDSIPSTRNTFENQRFIATQSNRSMNTSMLLPGNDYLFSISSKDATDVWKLDFSKPEYLRAVVEGMNVLKRALSSAGETDIQYSFPNSELMEISFIPFDPNGSKGGTGAFVRSILKERHTSK